MIPALVVAISSTVLPNCLVWSRSIAVKTATSAFATFVESHSPPIPTSKTKTSIGASEKIWKAIAVIASKNVSGCSPIACSFWSTSSRMGLVSEYVSKNLLSSIGSPSREMRSLKRTRCGDVSRPVFRPSSRKIRSIILAVEVFPFVPVM